MAEQNNDAYACELFDIYVGHLNRKFLHDEDAKEITDECVRIASDLLEMEYSIITWPLKKIVGSIALSPTMMQTVIVQDYDMALVKHEVPLREPLRTAHVTMSTCGPPFPIEEHVHNDEHPITEEDEAWFKRQLESMNFSL